MGSLVTYLAVGGVYFLGAVWNAWYVRDTIYRYPNAYWPETASRKKAESALMVLLTPIWPVFLVAAPVAVVMAVWALVQDVRDGYCKTNRKEVDDR